MEAFGKLVKTSINHHYEVILFEDLVRKFMSSEVESDESECIKPHSYYRVKNAKNGKIKTMRVFIGARNGHQVGPFEESLRRVDPDLMKGVKVEYKNMDPIKVLINQNFLMI